MPLVYFFLIAALVAAGPAAAGEFEKNPAGCRFAEAGAAVDFSLAKNMQTAGILVACGWGTADAWRGEVFLLKKERPETFPGGGGKVGGVSEGYGPFSVALASVKEVKNGFEVTDLIPFERDRRIPSFRRSITCYGAECTVGRRRCVFRRPAGSVERDALVRLKKNWVNAELAERMAAISAEIEKELPHKEGRPVEDGFNDDLMKVYRNALLGHRASRELLLDAKRLKTLDPAGGPPDGAEHWVIHNQLKALRQAGCLR
jgi:hypothetical protein